jgi:DNA-directed RNA polymerase specialized sigma24 family protein
MPIQHARPGISLSRPNDHRTPEAYEAAFIKRKLGQDLTMHEIGLLTGLSRQGVEAALKRGLAKIRAAYEHEQEARRQAATCCEQS